MLGWEFTTTLRYAGSKAPTAADRQHTLQWRLGICVGHWTLGHTKQGKSLKTVPSSGTGTREGAGEIRLRPEVGSLPRKYPKATNRIHKGKIRDTAERKTRTEGAWHLMLHTCPGSTWASLHSSGVSESGGPSFWIKSPDSDTPRMRKEKKCSPTLHCTALRDAGICTAGGIIPQCALSRALPGRAGGKCILICGHAFCWQKPVCV